MLSAASKEFKKFLDTRYRERTLARHLRSVAIFAKRGRARGGDGSREKAELLSFEPGQLIAEEGTPADAFYLVRGGYVKVSVRQGATDLAVTYLRTGDFAGEAGLLLEETWPFTLQALEHVELVKIARDDFRKIVATHPADRGAAVGASSSARLKQRGAVARDPVSSEYLQMAMETGLIHGESVLLIDLSTCTRCDECVRGCADAHGGEPRFIREGAKYRNWLVPTACYQCTDPVCMMDCPTGAITRDDRHPRGARSIPPPASAAATAPTVVRGATSSMVETGGEAAGRQARRAGDEVRPVPRPRRRARLRPDVPARLRGADLLQGHGPGQGHAALMLRSTERAPVRAALVLRPKQPPQPVPHRSPSGAPSSPCFSSAARLSPWSPKRGLGLAFGFLAALLFVFEMLYPARRPHARPFGTARAWIQAHVYLGLIAFLAVVLHAGFAWPQGGDGLVAARPLRLDDPHRSRSGSGSRSGSPPRSRKACRSRRSTSASPPSWTSWWRKRTRPWPKRARCLDRFYQQEVRERLARPSPSWSFLFDVRAGRDRALEPFRRMATFVPPEERGKVEDLMTLYTEKRELDAQLSLQAILRRWLVLHVPAAGLLMALLVVHVLSWVLY